MTDSRGHSNTRLRLQNAATVFGAGLLLGPPIGALQFSLYRAITSVLAWVDGIPRLAGEPKSFQLGHVLAFVYLAYVFTAAPALLASAFLSWRTWRSGGFSTFAAALTAGLCMLAYLGAVAVVFKNERVRIVDWELVTTAVLLAVCSALACTFLLRWAHVIEKGTSREL
jgi:hypothetical protein